MVWLTSYFIRVEEFKSLTCYDSQVVSSFLLNLALYKSIEKTAMRDTLN